MAPPEVSGGCGWPSRLADRMAGQDSVLHHTLLLPHGLPQPHAPVGTNLADTRSFSVLPLSAKGTACLAEAAETFVLSSSLAGAVTGLWIKRSAVRQTPGWDVRLRKIHPLGFFGEKNACSGATPSRGCFNLEAEALAVHQRCVQSRAVTREFIDSAGGC